MTKTSLTPCLISQWNTLRVYRQYVLTSRQGTFKHVEVEYTSRDLGSRQKGLLSYHNFKWKQHARVRVKAFSAICRTWIPIKEPAYCRHLPKNGRKGNFFAQHHITWSIAYKSKVISHTLPKIRAKIFGHLCDNVHAFYRQQHKNTHIHCTCTVDLQ